MSILPCPECHALTGRWLEATTQETYVNYYRCHRCGQIWTLAKREPDAVRTLVTTRAAEDRSHDGGARDQEQGPVSAAGTMCLERMPNDERGERFQILFIDGQPLGPRPGHRRNTTRPMTELEVRAFFDEGQQPSDDVDELFRVARAAFSH